MSLNEVEKDYREALKFYDEFTKRHPECRNLSLSRLKAEYGKARESRPSIKPYFAKYVRHRLEMEYLYVEYRKRKQRSTP